MDLLNAYKNIVEYKNLCGISRIREGEFSRIAVFSDIREVINSRIAVVRERIDKWARWVSAQGVRGVTAGEVGHTPAPGGCLPSREGVNSTLAFVLGQAVGVGLQDLAYYLLGT